MPANLTPQYLKAEQNFKAAKTVEEKIAALEEMQAVIPRHKGTEKIQADIKRRISKLHEAHEASGGKRADPFRIRKEGAGQVVILGPPNTGKSRLLERLTTAHPEVAPYPFTTLRPLPGMMRYEDIQIQLIDTGPLTSERIEPYHSNLCRAADLVLLTVDLAASDPIADLLDSIKALYDVKILLVADPSKAECDYGVIAKKTILLGCKCDEDDGVIAEMVREAAPELPFLAISPEHGEGLENLRVAIFDALNILRVYSKMPGHPPDMDSPFVLPRGSSVMDVARMVHKDFSEKLKYARIWGSERFDGQMVQRDYLVCDRDVIELHI